MKINAKQPSIKTYTLSHFKIGEVCMGVRDEHYYLDVKIVIVCYSMKTLEESIYK